MSRRPSIYVSRKIPAPTGKSPNNFFPQITTELRSFAPAQTPSIILAFELSMAVREFAVKLHHWGGPETTTVEDAVSVLSDYGLHVPAGYFDGAVPFPGPDLSS